MNDGNMVIVFLYILIFTKRKMSNKIKHIIIELSINNFSCIYI